MGRRHHFVHANVWQQSHRLWTCIGRRAGVLFWSLRSRQKKCKLAYLHEVPPYWLYHLVFLPFFLKVSDQAKSASSPASSCGTFDSIIEGYGQPLIFVFDFYLDSVFVFFVVIVSVSLSLSLCLCNRTKAKREGDFSSHHHEFFVWFRCCTDDVWRLTLSTMQSQPLF